MTTRVIFSIVLYQKHEYNKNKTISIFPNTERELRTILNTKFEILETHRNEDIAKQRLSELRKQYKPSKKGYRHSRLANKNKSIRMTGKGNPMYGKKHSEHTKQLMSKSHTGVRPRLGHTNTDKQKRKYKNKRKHWTPVLKGSKLYHSIITGEHIRIPPGKLPPPDYSPGFSDEIKELLRERLDKSRHLRKYRPLKNKQSHNPE